MTAAVILVIISWTITFVALAFCAHWYHELWKWARQCQNARIAIAFKKKVVLQAPLLEWLLWCNMLDKDKDANGRTVFSRNGVSVAIVKRPRNSRIRQAIRNVRKPGRSALAEGTWTSQKDGSSPVTDVTRNNHTTGVVK